MNLELLTYSNTHNMTLSNEIKGSVKNQTIIIFSFLSLIGVLPTGFPVVSFSHLTVRQIHNLTGNIIKLFLFNVMLYF